MKKKKTGRVPFSTRQLLEIIAARFEKYPELGTIRINSKWQLQIRKKHLRRLRKKLKNATIEGRYIYKQLEKQNAV